MNNCYSDITVTLGGRVIDMSSVPLSDVSILYTVDCVPRTVRTDASGNYSITAPEGSRVIIRPELDPGVRATPEKYALLACSGRMDLDFIVRSVTPGVFAISGTLSGLPNAAGLAVAYTVNGQSGIAMTDAQGNYSITAPAGSNVMVTPPSQAGFTVSPSEYVFPNLSSNMTGQNFVYSASAFDVSGTVSGLPNVSGILIAYTINGQLFTTLTNASGDYFFMVAPGADVLIQPTAQSGYTVSPLSYQIPNINSESVNNNFVYTPLLTVARR